MSSTSAIHPCISTTANNTTTTTTNTTTTTATTNTTSYFANAPLQYDENECPATPGTATMTKASTAMMFDFTSPPSSSSSCNEEEQKQEEKQQLGQNNNEQPLKLSITTTPTLSLKTKASRPTPIHTSLLNHPTTSNTNNNNVVPPISKLSTNTHRLSSPVVTTALPSPTSSSSCSPSPLSLRLSQRPQSSGAKSLCSVPSCVSQRKLAGRLSGSSSTTSGGAVGGGNGDGSKGRSPYVRPVDHSSTSNQQVCRILDGALVKRDELIRIRSCGTPNSACHVQRQHLNSMFVVNHHSNNNNNHGGGDVGGGSGDQQTPLSPVPSSSSSLSISTTTTTMTSNNVFSVQRREDGAAPSPPTTPTTNVTSSTTTTSTAIATSTARKNMLANRKAAVRKNITLSVVTCQHSIDV